MCFKHVSQLVTSCSYQNDNSPQHCLPCGLLFLNPATEERPHVNYPATALHKLPRESRSCIGNLRVAWAVNSHGDPEKSVGYVPCKISYNLYPKNCTIVQICGFISESIPYNWGDCCRVLVIKKISFPTNLSGWIQMEDSWGRDVGQQEAFAFIFLG